MSTGGRVAVVTGAASGLGAALAGRLAADGARVVLADVVPGPLEAVREELAGTGADVLAVPTDVTDPAAVDALAAAAVERFGTVHVIANVAGTVLGGPAWEIPLEDWRRLLDVNLWGVVHGIRSFVPILLAHDEPAHVVNMGSQASVTALAGLGPYVASKHAVLGLSEALLLDLQAAGHGDRIGVSVVCPGYVPTRLGLADRDAPPPVAPPGAISAGDVADAIVAAVAERRFTVFTHEGSEELVTGRAAALAAGRPYQRPR